MVERNFRRKKVKSLTLGEKLRQLREDRRMRVFDLARKIHVKDKYVTALENGDYENLPTKVYAKGFVRSYARFFGVPEDVLLNLFEREYSVHSNINYKEEEEGVNRLPKVPRLVFTPRIIFGALAILILASVGVYLYFGVDSFVSSPWLVVDSPGENTVVKENKIIVQGKTRSNSRVTINGQQVFVDMEGGFTEEIALAQGMNSISVKSVNKFNKESIQEIVVDAQYDIAIEENADDEYRVQLFIKAKKKSVWINVSADDVEVYNDTLQADEEKEFNAAGQITLTTSDGESTLFRGDDGEFVPISEDGGIVKNWIFPLEDKSDEEDEMQEQKE